MRDSPITSPERVSPDMHMNPNMNIIALSKPQFASAERGLALPAVIEFESN